MHLIRTYISQIKARKKESVARHQHGEAAALILSN